MQLRASATVFAAIVALSLLAAGCGGGSSDPASCTPTAEVCDGVDNDCDPGTGDGAEDPLAGTACDGPDSDLCEEGTTSCVGGELACSDNTGGAIDVCDGADNDCDPASLDGAEDPLAGTACDGLDSDLCMEGTTSCVGGELACSDNTGSTLDVCDGVDNDCDPGTGDGAEDPLAGTACDGPDSDLCPEGTSSCVGGELSCSDTTGSTLDVCDGADNDCDLSTPDGADDPLAGAACDGLDSDLCVEGTRSCVSGTMECSDTTGGTLDVCDGADNDCDPASLDGAEDPLVGVACDGPDSDLCMEGTWSCGSWALACSDATGSTLDLCDGGDDDCDPATPDGAEDPLNGAACAEGDLVCSGADLVCTAPPGPGVEACDGVDNDGDASTDEDFPELGGACSLGLGACEAAGMMICSATGATSVCDAVPGTPSAEVDDDIDNDCDGEVDEEEGFSRCHDGMDNDGDAQTDCGDWGCAAVCVENTEALCHDGMDNDQAQGADCADPDCAAFCSEATIEECQDGKDNDQDGQTDCTDAGCALVCP